jgi:hypothetical protein
MSEGSVNQVGHCVSGTSSDGGRVGALDSQVIKTVGDATG